MKPFRITEIFSTIQGEGSRAGSPAVFIRFTGCNLWSGIEEKRGSGKGECARWCDTFFAKGERFSIQDVFEVVCELTKEWKNPFVVISGGEPMLQLKRPEGIELLQKLKEIRGLEVAIETNGTVTGDVLKSLNHITVSPKAIPSSPGTSHVKVRSGADLKVIVPGYWSEKDLLEFSTWDFDNFYFQPKDTGDSGASSICVAVEMSEKYGWRVSFQTHKYAGLP